MIKPAEPRRSTWWALFALVLIGMLAWSFATPLMSAPDEGTHAVRAASVARGQLTGPSRELIIENWVVQVPEAYGHVQDALCFGEFPFTLEKIPAASRTPECVPSFVGGDRLVDALTYEFRGTPHIYGFLGLPSLLVPDRWGMFMMRGLNALICAALLAGACVSALHRPGRRLAIVGVLAAATPMTWYLGGVINPNGIEIAAAIALWSSLLPLALGDSAESDHRLVIRSGVALAVLVGIRALGPAFALIALIAFATLAEQDRLRAIVRRVDTRIWLGVAFASAAITAAWVTQVGINEPGPFEGLGFRRAVEYLPTVFRESIGRFGPNDVALPRVLTYGWGAIVLVAIVIALWRATTRQRIVLGTLVLAAIALPLMANGFTVPRIGFAWQGRYGLPLTAGVVVIAFGVQRDGKRRAGRTLGAIAATLLLAGQLAAFMTVGRRLGMGNVTGWNVFDYATRARWEPGIPSGVLLALMVVVVSGLGFLIIPVLARRPAAPIGHPVLSDA